MGGRFSVPGSADLGGDDYWTPAEHEEYARAIEDSWLRDERPGLRRAERRPRRGRLPGLDLVASDAVPRDEVWLCEPLTPLQRAAGFRPRVPGKIVGLGD